MAGAIVPVSLAIVTLSVGSAVVGAYVAYQAYRGFRRNESRPMQYLSIGLFLLTGVFVVAFVGSVLLRRGIVPVRFEQAMTLFTRLLQFLGVAFIAYSLHRRP
jgi:hypothetical protein